MNEEVDWFQTDYESLPEVQLLREYVRIDTSATTGDEVPGAEFLAQQLKAAGIPSHIERLSRRRANLWAFLEGEVPEAIVLHNHIDVEPVRHPDAWKHPPFDAVIDLPWMYGRGTFDMKSVAIAQLEAMIALKKSGNVPYRSVLFLATSEEEQGSDLGTRWILRFHPELVSRMWAVLTEGGVVEGRSLSDIKYWGTEVAQKTFVDRTACSSSRDRLEGLGHDIAQVGFPIWGLDLIPEVRELFQAYGPTRDRTSLRNWLADPEIFLRDPGAVILSPPYIRSMLRNEVVPFPIQEAQGGGYEMLLKFHLLPGADLESVSSTLLPDWVTHGVTLSEPMDSEAFQGSPTDHPVFQTISDLLEEAHPGVPTGPWFLSWSATDACHFRAHGIPSYGFTPFFILSTDTLHVGTANEKIALPGFVSGVELYRQLLFRLTQ